MSEVPLYLGGDAEREGVAAGAKHPELLYRDAPPLSRVSCAVTTSMQTFMFPLAGSWMSHEPASGLYMARV